MALINCPECGKEISDSSEKCIHCGYPIKPQTPIANNIESGRKKTNKLIMVCLVIGLVIAIGVIIALLVPNGGKSKATCKAAGCTKAVYSNGFCIDHYGNQRSGDEVTVAESEISGDSTDKSNGFAEDNGDDVTTFSKNSTIKTETCEFTLIGYNIEREIEPANCTSSYYHYYEASAGNVFVDVKFKIKNLRKSAVDQDAVVTSVKVFYDGDYEYRCSAVTVDKDGDFEGYTSLYSINALETMEYHMLAEVPSEVKNSSKSIKVQVVADGTTYECTLR